MRFALALVGVALSLSSLPAAAQDKPPQHVRGDIVAMNGDTMDVRTRAGQVVHVKVPDSVGVAKVEEASASDITDGSFVGVTAVPQSGGKLVAKEVHIFPEEMRGTGEGHRPWDLGAGSSMTNATVSGMGAGKAGAAKQGTGSSMTNATVAGTKKSGGERTLQLKYKDGQQTVLVPSNVPVVKLAKGDRSLLKPGAHVFVIATEENGTLTAQRMTVGEGGVAPPM